MSDIVFVNHSEIQCGIYQHGLRTAQILSKDLRIELLYIEANSHEEFLNKMGEFKPDAIIYQWHQSTMPWLTNNIISSIPFKQFIFYQEATEDIPRHLGVDGYIMGNMDNDPHNDLYSVPRALVEKKVIKKTKNNIPMIGSFGLATSNKNFAKMCSRVADEFNEAIINIHLTRANMISSLADKMMSDAIDSCVNSLKGKNNIELRITTDFISDEGIINFLQKNDINLFFYDDMSRRGIASATDYAIGGESVFGVNDSIMFRHIHNVCPEINIDKNTIHEIINMGNLPALKMKKMWSNAAMCDRFIEIISGES
jgi:hypothetical protein